MANTEENNDAIQMSVDEFGKLCELFMKKINMEEKYARRERINFFGVKEKNIMDWYLESVEQHCTNIEGLMAHRKRISLLIPKFVQQNVLVQHKCGDNIFYNLPLRDSSAE